MHMIQSVGHKVFENENSIFGNYNHLLQITDYNFNWQIIMIIALYIYIDYIYLFYIQSFSWQIIVIIA